LYKVPTILLMLRL